MIKTITAAFLFVLVSVVPVVVGADLETATAAYNAGDYATAYNEWKRLAEQGDVSAQYHLGGLYANGEGLPQNHKEASKWWRLAAEQGYAEAQAALGILYLTGLGLPQNYVECYAWSNIAAAAGNKGGEVFRDHCAKKLDTESLNKAQAKAAEYWEKYGSE